MAVSDDDCVAQQIIATMAAILLDRPFSWLPHYHPVCLIRDLMNAARV